jgi:hypothetical protein
MDNDMYFADRGNAYTNSNSPVPIKENNEMKIMKAHFA